MKSSNVKATSKRVEVQKNKMSKTTTSQEQSVSTKREDNQEISQEEILQMSSEMLSSMNSKIQSLEQVKKSLEQKLKEVDEKVSSKEKTSKTKSNTNIKNSSSEVLGLSHKELEAELQTLEIIKEVYSSLKQSASKTSLKDVNTFIQELELVEKQINTLSTTLLQKSSSKINYSQTLELILSLKAQIQVLLHQILSTLNQKHSISTQSSAHKISKTQELFNELQLSKNHLEQLVSSKLDTKELSKVVTPLQNRVEHIQEVLDKTSVVESKKKKELIKSLNSKISSLENHIGDLEKSESQKVSKTAYKKDLQSLLKEVEFIVSILENVNFKEKQIEKELNYLHIGKVNIEKELQTLSSKEVTHVTKEYVSSQIAFIEKQLTSAFVAIEKSKELEHKDVQKVKKELTQKINSVNALFLSMYQAHTNFVTKSAFIAHKKELQNEILAIIETLQRANSKEKAVEKQISSMKKVEHTLQRNIKAVEDEVKTTVVHSDTLQAFEKKTSSSIYTIINSIQELQEKDAKAFSSIKSALNKRIVLLQNIIDSFNKKHESKEHSIINRVNIVNDEIAAIIEILQKAASKEKSLEKVVIQLIKLDKEEQEKLSKIQSQLSILSTKKEVQHMISQIDSQFRDLQEQLLQANTSNLDEFSKLQQSLISQRAAIEDEIQSLDNTSHKTFATKSYTSKQVKKLQQLEENHSNTHQKQIKGLSKAFKNNKKEYELRVEALRNSLSELYNKSHHFMDKVTVKKSINDILVKIDALKKVEEVDSKTLEAKLKNLAQIFSKEISSFSKIMSTLTPKSDVEKIKKELTSKLTNLSKELSQTQQDLAQESIKYQESLHKEHSNLLSVKKHLEKRVEELHESILEQYYTKKEINTFKKQLKDELNSLSSLQDASIQIVEDELTNLAQVSMNHQKKLSQLSKKIKTDEDLMSTHKEVTDVAAALQDTLKHAKTQLKKKSTEQKNQLMQEIKALLSSENDREQRIQELTKKVKKTYSKDQLDKAFTDIADEVERFKLHEEHELNSLKTKENKDVKELRTKTKELEEHTQLECLQKQLTQELEKRVQELKEEQLKHYDQISKIQAHEQRLDTTEELLEEKEELLEEKIKNQFEDLQKAKEHWEEFFSNIKHTIEVDENSLANAHQSIEVLKQELKEYSQKLNKIEVNQTPLKQYLVDKYNVIVDAFHTMQKEHKKYEDELQERQKELIADKFNAYHQEILQYREQLKEAREVINTFIDERTAVMYENFEESMKQYKAEYTQEIVQLQTTINSYLEQVKKDEKEFTDLMTHYIGTVNTKIEEVNQLEVDFETLLHKARKNVDEYIQTNITSIHNTFDTMLKEKTDTFLSQEMNLLSSYHSKIHNLEDNLNTRLDMIESKFVEKNISSIKEAIKDEIENANETIRELQHLEQENKYTLEKVEESLLNTITTLEEKKEEISLGLQEKIDSAEIQFIDFEKRSQDVEDKVSQNAQERMTQFEQHLNKRYLETEEKISRVKEILVDEVEGMMRDVGHDIHRKKEEIDTFLKSTLGVSSLAEELQSFQNRISQLEGNLEAVNASFVLTDEVSSGENNSNFLGSTSVQMSSNDNIPIFSKNAPELHDTPLAQNAHIELTKLKEDFEKLLTRVQTHTQVYIDSQQDTSKGDIQSSSKIVRLENELASLKSELEKINSRVEVNSAIQTFKSNTLHTKSVPVVKPSDIEVMLTNESDTSSLRLTPQKNIKQSLEVVQEKKGFLKTLFSNIFSKKKSFETLEPTQVDTLQSNFQENLQIIDSNIDELKKLELNSTGVEITFRDLKHYNSSIQKEIKSIIEFVKNSDSKTSEMVASVESLSLKLRNLQDLESKLEAAQKETVQVSQMAQYLQPLKQELEVFKQETLKFEHEDKTTIENLTQTIQSRITSIEHLIDSNEKSIANTMSQVEKHTSNIDSTIEEIIKTLKRASAKEKSLEVHVDEIETKISAINNTIQGDEEHFNYELGDLYSQVQELRIAMENVKNNVELINARNVFDTTQDEMKLQEEDAVTRLSAVETTLQQLKGQVHANTVYQTFQNEVDRKVQQLFRNQEKMAYEMKKAFLDARNMLFETHSQMYELKKEFEEIKEDTHYKPVDIDTTAHKLVHSMKAYEDELVMKIKNLQERGHESENIEYILAEEGHPVFYVRSILDMMFWQR